MSKADFDNLEDVLKNKFRSTVRNVRVFDREGVVVVQGTTVSYYAKQMVQHHMLAVLGNRPLVNELQVAPPDLVEYSV